MALFIGLMSGNSLDAVDVVLADFGCANPLIAHASVPIPAHIQQCVRQYDHTAIMNDYMQIDRHIAMLSVQAIQRVLSHADVSADAITAIGSHGQTLAHFPEADIPYTLQVGDPHWIAAHTGIPVVSGFRQRDMVLGGQGAPLAPIFHAAYLCRNVQTECVVVNIGGIANITHVLANGTAQAGFDTGPGNVLLDAWCRAEFACSFDEDGQRASQGQLDAALLERMLQDPYFIAPAPKSTGQDYFNMSWLSPYIAQTFSAFDILATLTHLTARSIAEAIDQMPSARRVYVCGGGAKNQLLMACLSSYLPAYIVATTDVLGVDPQLVEAFTFAYLAKCHVEDSAVDMRSITGANQPYTPGVWYPA